MGGGGLVVNNNDIGVNISNNLVYHDNAYDLVKIPNECLLYGHLIAVFISDRLTLILII